MRNALALVPKKQQPAVSTMIRTAFAQETQQQAHHQWRHVADQLRDKRPKLAGLMDDAEHDVLAYRGFHPDHARQIHSTNPLERLNGEIKRRTRTVGIFPTENAIYRLVGALLLEQNDEWQVSRRYMSVESLAPDCDGDDPAAACLPTG